MYCDLHNHLLPGVDDGCTSMDETLGYLSAFRQDGVTALVFSPHLLLPELDRDGIRAELERHRTAFEQVVDAAASHESAPELRLGQEILARTAEEIEPVVASQDVGIAGGDALLVEFGFEPGFDAESVIRRVRAEGRRIVVAHPERYDYSGADPVESVARWREWGAWIQVNGGSLADLYRERATRVSRCLLAEGLVDMVCTDHHGDFRPHAPAMIAEMIEAVGEPGLAGRLMVRGPRAVMGRTATTLVA